MEGTQSRAELEANLQEYRSQLKQVEELLLMGEGGNEEMQDMYNSLTEVIQLTEELLREAEEAEAAAGGSSGAAAATSVGGSSGAGPSHAAASAAAGSSAGASGSGQAIITPPALNLPSILPASVAEQIRRAQIRAALAGTAPAAWLVGAKVQALYVDGQHYNALVESVDTEGSKAVVLYEGYDERAEVTLSSLREKPEEVEVYKGVTAPKRKRVEEQPAQLITEIPKWLQIKEGDDEKTVQRKKKLLKSYKSKMRFQNMDLQTKKKQDNWKDFVSGKGSKKKTGFLTGMKKESIFAVPEGVNSKVGVVGSGKGMTQYQKAKPVQATLPHEQDL